MPHLETLIRIGGVLHLGILLASALVPGVLQWRSELARLGTLTRQLVWVHGAFIVFTIAGFGIISILHAPALATGSPLARTFCGFVALFWLGRFSLQFTLFDARPYLTTTVLKLGHGGLTAGVAYLGAVYALGALGSFSC